MPVHFLGGRTREGRDPALPVANLWTNPNMAVDLNGYSLHQVIGTRVAVPNGWALQLTTSVGGSSDNFAVLNADTGGLRAGMQAGKTYTVSATVDVLQVQTAPHSATRSRNITVFTRIGTGAYVESSPTNVPNAVGSYRRALTFTVPVAATEAFIRLYLGSAVAGETVRWRDVRLVEGTQALAEVTPADGSLRGYAWEGAAGASRTLALPVADWTLDHALTDVNRWNNHQCSRGQIGGGGALITPSSTSNGGLWHGGTVNGNRSGLIPVRHGEFWTVHVEHDAPQAVPRRGGPFLESPAGGTTVTVAESLQPVDTNRRVSWRTVRADPGQTPPIDGLRPTLYFAYEPALGAAGTTELSPFNIRRWWITRTNGPAPWRAATARGYGAGAGGVTVDRRPSGRLRVGTTPVTHVDVRRLILRNGPIYSENGVFSATGGLVAGQAGPTGLPVWRMQRVPGTPNGWGVYLAADLPGTEVLPAFASLRLTWHERANAVPSGAFQIVTDPATQAVHVGVATGGPGDQVWRKRTATITAERDWIPGLQRFRTAVHGGDTSWLELSDVTVEVL